MTYRWSQYLEFPRLGIQLVRFLLILEYMADPRRWAEVLVYSRQQTLKHSRGWHVVIHIVSRGTGGLAVRHHLFVQNRYLQRSVSRCPGLSPYTISERAYYRLKLVVIVACFVCVPLELDKLMNLWAQTWTHSV